MDTIAGKILGHEARVCDNTWGDWINRTRVRKENQTRTVLVQSRLTNDDSQYLNEDNQYFDEIQGTSRSVVVWKCT